MEASNRRTSFVKVLATILLIQLFISCLSTKNSGSTVLSFRYGGYGDTVYALISGEIYERRAVSVSKDSLLPIGNVQIEAEQNGKVTFTNPDGKFTIGLEKGVFSLLITKEGYQSLRITNYISDPDQMSGATILLEKGKEVRTFEIKKP